MMATLGCTRDLLIRQARDAATEEIEDTARALLVTGRALPVIGRTLRAGVRILGIFKAAIV